MTQVDCDGVLPQTELEHCVSLLDTNVVLWLEPSVTNPARISQMFARAHELLGTGERRVMVCDLSNARFQNARMRALTRAELRALRCTKFFIVPPASSTVMRVAFRMVLASLAVTDWELFPTRGAAIEAALSGLDPRE